MPTRTVAPIHFDDFDGHQFERLVFAYLLRSEKWRVLEWYGQSGSDLGRDIWGIREAGSTLCTQCVNRQKFVATKAKRDLDKIIRARSGVPDGFLVVCSSSVSAKVRDAVKAYAKKLAISHCEIWSGNEFEERLRQRAENLLSRFIEGVVFPDEPVALREFAELEDVTDESVIERLFRVFDRPAFQTPFHQESSLPGFRQAIGDTIQALNTGIWQTRDGKEIERLPSRHQLANPVLRDALAVVVLELTELRARFEQLIRDGEIRPCGCNTPDCPVFLLAPGAAHEMDRLRASIVARVLNLPKQAEKSKSSSGQTVNVVSTNNSGIIANNVTVRGGGPKPKGIIIPGSIATDPQKYNYVEYLVKRLTDFRDLGSSYGQRRGGKVHPGATRKILENQLGGLTKDLPLGRFDEIVRHLKEKIDNTAQGRRNGARGTPSYHSFENHPGSKA